MLLQKSMLRWGFDVKLISKKTIMRMFTAKNKASTVVSDMIPVLITIVITGMLALCYTLWVANFETKQHIDAIAREYILRMSTVGYLTTEDKELLLEELDKCNMENISLLGTTEYKVNNGEKVTLKVSGDYNYKEVKFLDVFFWKADGTEVTKKRLEIEKCTTAIY